jgi:hypothetical protein
LDTPVIETLSELTPDGQFWYVDGVLMVGGGGTVASSDAAETLAAMSSAVVPSSLPLTVDSSAKATVGAACQPPLNAKLTVSAVTATPTLSAS